MYFTCVKITIFYECITLLQSKMKDGITEVGPPCRDYSFQAFCNLCNLPTKLQQGINMHVYMFIYLQQQNMEQTVS